MPLVTSRKMMKLPMWPQTRAELDEGDADKLLRMIDMLEDLDEVQDVYTNAEISDEILDAVG